ncbi:MAG: hypothetical protein ABI868_03810 [Acidobacteriota bacterium]
MKQKSRTSLQIKIFVVLVLLPGLGFLFKRSLRDDQTRPYTVARGQLRNWSVVTLSASRAADPMLALRPPPDLVPGLFSQVFARAMQSLRSPNDASMPLLLKGEFDRALDGFVTPDAITAAARTAGLEAIELRPRCLIHKYISAPGDIRQLFVVLFEAPEFTRFREQIGGMRADGAATRAGYDPWALSPALFIAASDAAFTRWLPFRADPVADCLAPIVIQP